MQFQKRFSCPGGRPLVARHLLRQLGGIVLPILLGIISSLPLSAPAQPLAGGQEKFLGCGTSSYLYRDLDKYWNQITPGNDGKWGSVEAVRGQYNWTNLDRIYHYAVNRNIPFKHHTLVWGNQQPGWIASLDSAAQRAAVENWIQAVGERYPRVAFVDVVNEPFNAPPVYRKALGGDGATGWDWVITAFQLARQHCAPGVQLVLNEYNVLHSNTVTSNYLVLINLLKERGLIDGIGVQGHYFEFRSDLASSNTYVHDLATIKSNLMRLTATGLPVYLTEFDIDEPIDANQLEQYKIYFPIFWSNPGVKGITLWGYIQGDVWTAHPNTYVLRSDGSERPALQWLRTYLRSPQPPVLLSPLFTVGVPRNPVLLWRPVATATAYRVQVGLNSVFTTAIVDTTVADTLVQTPVLEAGRRFYWRVSAINAHGASEYSAAASFTTGDQIVGVQQQGEAWPPFQLAQNYPNPFNPTTQIKYTIAQHSRVSLKVFSPLGREVALLFDGFRQPGSYVVSFDGSGLTTGVYICRLQANAFTATKKLTLLK